MDPNDLHSMANSLINDMRETANYPGIGGIGSSDSIGVQAGVPFDSGRRAQDERHSNRNDFDNPELTPPAIPDIPDIPSIPGFPGIDGNVMDPFNPHGF